MLSQVNGVEQEDAVLTIRFAATQRNGRKELALTLASATQAGVWASAIYEHKEIYAEEVGAALCCYVSRGATSYTRCLAV